MSVTFALLCYNQEKFIREAVRGAFGQDYQPLEILISDDHSTDASFDILQEEVAKYSGPHTVRLVRNSENLGFENFARTAEAASGEFLISAHGDDISHPGRTQALVEAWRSTNASLLSSNAEVIDEDSRLQDPLTSREEALWVSAAEIARRGYLLEADGATLAWHRDVFAKFGRLDGLRLRGQYDHVLPFRASMLNGVRYLPSLLVQRRTHGGNYGLELADRSQGQLVKQETRTMYGLSAKLCMLEDLDYLRGRNPTNADLVELREVLITSILELARKANLARNELFALGMRPTWISREEMEQRDGYAKGYLLRSQNRRAERKPPNRLRKLLAALKS